MLNTTMDLIRKSLDNDLSALTASGNLSLELALMTQTVRLLRGKQLQVVETPVQGWTPDGKAWLPGMPGTVTPQESQNEKK